jgi:hypothetical protein
MLKVGLARLICSILGLVVGLAGPPTPSPPPQLFVVHVGSGAGAELKERG